MFQAVLYAFSIEKTRCLDSLYSDLTRLLTDSVSLPLGVRYVFRVSDGKTVKGLDDFEEGECPSYPPTLLAVPFSDKPLHHPP